MKAGEINLDSTEVCDRRTRLAPDKFNFPRAAWQWRAMAGLVWLPF